MSKLTVSGLSISFDGLSVLKDVSFEVAPNSFVGLMGPNGAGKTTVINCISRIYQPTAGQISFDGQNLLTIPADQILRCGVSRTFQDLNFINHIPNMTVLDYLRLGQFDPARTSILKDGFRFPKAITYERELTRNARRILEFFYDIRNHLEPPEEERQYPFLHGREGFPDLIDAEFSPIGILSFAWRRRLDLARALVSNPKLVLLDEPAQGLAPSEIENLGTTLKYIQSEFGVAALIVEHNIATLMKISDRVIAMNLGHIVAEGLPEEVRTNREVIRIYLGGTEAAKALPATILTEASPKSPADSLIDTEVPLLEVRNLDVHYGFAQALFSVSLKIKASQVISVLGTNGSGKSTLLRTISGAERPTFGEIFLRGQPLPVGQAELAVERGIQYVPQGHVIFPELSVLKNLRIGSLVFEKSGLKFEDGLAKVFYYFPELEKYLNVQAASLSGGQRQMLAISQAIIGSPSLLLLDEPSLGLSPILVENLFRVIKRISVEERCSVMLVEQSVSKALEVSDYIFMMSSGVLIAEGTSDQFRGSDSSIQKYLGFH